MAQMILASLLARAMAVSIRDLHASIRASHDPGFPPFRPRQWMIDIAPLAQIPRIPVLGLVPTWESVGAQLLTVAIVVLGGWYNERLARRSGAA